MPGPVSFRDEVSRRSEDQPQDVGWNPSPLEAEG
jgi:hypothetical protein